MDMKCLLICKRYINMCIYFFIDRAPYTREIYIYIYIYTQSEIEKLQISKGRRLYSI